MQPLTRQHTNVWGVYEMGSRGKAKVLRRLKSMQEANEAAREEFSLLPQEGMDEEDEIDEPGRPYYKFACLGYGASCITIFVEELRLDELTVEDLKEMCRDHGLSPSGTKAVLTDRCRAIVEQNKKQEESQKKETGGEEEEEKKEEEEEEEGEKKEQEGTTGEDKANKEAFTTLGVRKAEDKKESKEEEEESKKQEPAQKKARNQ
ncbi:SWI/SNF complex subunit SMARCC2-like [Balamuthia mandrillaris]